MQALENWTVGKRQVSVKLMERKEVKCCALDALVASLAGAIRDAQVVICETSLIDLFSEDQDSERARIRRLIAEAADETDQEIGQTSDGTQRQPLKFKWLANSIENVAIYQVAAAPPTSIQQFSTPATAFVPIQFVGELDMSWACPGGPIVSDPWKANTVDVFELENRFVDELRSWRNYEPPSAQIGQDEARRALARTLGIAETMDRLEEQYQYGREIGKAVGLEHENQWLAMDLKLEHFIWGPGIAHVDHANDVLLFRQPTVEECGKSIAPLYQQMSYSLWHPFREGYWDTRRREALDVILLFDGFMAGEILGVRAISNAVEARNEDRWDEALEWCEDARLAFQAFVKGDDGDGKLYLARVKLVRGDLFAVKGKMDEAVCQYDEARRELELLMSEGVPAEFEITSSLINSAAALTELGKPEDARERLLRAQQYVAQLPHEEPVRQSMSDAINRNLALLNAESV